MTLLRQVARPMLASIFVLGGVYSLRDPKPRAAKAQPVADALGRIAPGLRLGPTGLVRANGIVHLAAGLALATGRFPRVSAALLAATMPPTTVTGHQFWNESDPAARTNQLLHFAKNVAVTGGLLMSTLDPDPHKPGVLSRVRRTAASASSVIGDKIGDVNPASSS